MSTTRATDSPLIWIWAHHPRAIPLPGFRNTAQALENTTALALGPLTPEQHGVVERALTRDAEPLTPR